MGFFSFLDPILNFIFGPLLWLPSFWSIVVISFVISLIIIICYKFFTNQNEMKLLKDEQKELQKQMKELKDNPSKVMDIQKQAMQTNMKYMMKSMKPTLITFIPIILIFGWLQANMAFMPIVPGQDFSMELDLVKGISGTVNISVPEKITLHGDSSRTIEDGKVVFSMRGEAGVYRSPGVEFSINGKTYTQQVIITNGREYVQPVLYIKDDFVKSITTSNTPLKVLNLFGWKLSWFWTYLILAIAFSMGLRKLLRVY